MSKQVTLWQLLNDPAELAVTIPMIQRDYAQGRPDKGHILGPFLTDIRDCLSGKTEKLSLDFVYGNADSDRYYPLDGQQRLTTLWLVHWYLAFRQGILKRKKESLKRFSYQTRNSSSDFCEKLCDEMAKVDPEGIESVAKYIIGQTWFFADWLQDPTVNAMLRALGGNKAIKSGDREEADKQDTANIEDVFESADLNLCWENLTANRKITFQRMVIGTDQLPISDDLYIKMNARGKKLTDFENFKADLVAHIQKLSDIPNKLHYSTKLDGDWTDVFWNDRKDEKGFDGNIDPLFFMFINRFVLNQHCLKDVPASNYDASKSSADDENTKNLQNIFNTLYGSKLGKKGSNDDSLIEYKGFDVYKDYMTAENLEKLDNIFKYLKQYAKDIRALHLTSTDEISDENTEQQFRFLPHFKENTLVATALKERVYFHSICLFLEKPSRSSNRLENWLRVVRNLTENAAINNIEAMINCLRLVNNLGLYLQQRDWDLYNHLGDFVNDNHEKLPKKGTALGDQWIEEREKAEQIRKTEGMEETIKIAENYGFFEGTIRFLYTGRDGKPDWDSFGTKFENAKALFPGKEVPASTIKSFLGRFESFDDIEALEAGQKKRYVYLYTTFGSHSRKNCWKKHILCNDVLQQQVHDFLMGAGPVVSDPLYRDFLTSRAVEVICKQESRSLYRYYYSRANGIHREHGQKDEGLYISKERLKQNKQLLDLVEKGTVKLETGIDLGNYFLFGKRISFEYHGKKYAWYVEWGNADKNKLCATENEEARIDWPDGETLVNLLPALETL